MGKNPNATFRDAYVSWEWSIGKNDTAWNYRDANYAVVIVGDPAYNNNKITKWAKDHWNDLRPYAMKGAYVNFMIEEGRRSGEGYLWR